MRYEDWDILLFPRDCKVPFKEFKVACHVVHDNEFAHTHGSIGLPTVCCFVPSIAPGSLYKLSIHSWSTPPVSQFTRTYSKYVDDITFEARLFVDGCLVSSTSFERTGPWPNVMKHSLEVPGVTDLEPLKFPVFRRELLQQNYWSPADDLGRLRVVISEVFPRDSGSVPKERVKNVVAFAFQHAPLEVLESSSIAWPNTAMWRTMPFASSTSISVRPLEDVESHAHSPCGSYSNLRAISSAGQSENSLREGLQPYKCDRAQKRQPIITSENPTLSTPTTIGVDPFIEANAYFEWLSGMGMGVSADTGTGHAARPAIRDGRKSSTDISMPDYLPSDQLIQLDGDHFELKHDDNTSITQLKVPTNTPTPCDNVSAEQRGTPFSLLPHDSPLSMGLANSLTNSLLSQSLPFQMPHADIPIPSAQVRSRKENKRQVNDSSISTPGKFIVGEEDDIATHKSSQHAQPVPEACTPVSAVATVQEEVISSQPTVGGDRTGHEPTVPCGTSERRGKRLRNFTPTSSKPFEDDEEPCRANARIRLTPCPEAEAKGSSRPT